MQVNKKEVIKSLELVKISGSDKNIIDTGALLNVQVFGDEVIVDVECTTPALHVRKKLEVDILKTIHDQVYQKAKVKVNVSVKPGAKEESQEIKGPVLPGVENIIAIASGKGGVGKSTVTANLAVALAKKGFKVGVVDADIYGPSMPLMFDVELEKPEVVNVDGVNKMKPVENYGVKLLSIGFFAQSNQAVVWRGPMASKALNQLIKDAHWGELDFLLIDLPPGTGDVHLSLVQAVPVDGAVVVSTPQRIALADARKGVGMFQMDSINVPVLGLVENMAYFTPEELPDNKYYIFGKDGAKLLAEELEVALLAQVPLVQGIREAADAGRPLVLQDGNPVAEIYDDMAAEMVKQLVLRNEKLPASRKVEITTMAGCSK